MKVKIITLWLIASMTGCGRSSGDNGSDGLTTENGQLKHHSLMVATLNDLPACTAVAEGWLVYIKAASSFKVCSAEKWAAVDIKGEKGADGTNGLAIVENKRIPGNSYNICTKYYLIEKCYFNGGQVVKFSDNSILLTGAYRYALFHSGDDGAEYDRFFSSHTVVIDPQISRLWIRLDWEVSRDDIAFESLFLVYQRSPEKIHIVFDTNGNGEPDSNDETVLNLQLQNW